jgi:hypothetical protein
MCRPLTCVLFLVSLAAPKTAHAGVYYGEKAFIEEAPDLWPKAEVVPGASQRLPIRPLKLLTGEDPKWNVSPGPAQGAEFEVRCFVLADGTPHAGGDRGSSPIPTKNHRFRSG